jgi:hypothetical protein
MSKVIVKKHDDGFTHRKFFIDDSSENYLHIKQNDKIIIVSVKLGSETKTRRIGRVTKSTKTIEIRRIRDKHLFRKGNSYGFCFYVLKYQDSFDWVRLSDDAGGQWKIPVQYILDNGSFLNFMNNGGFELQIFLSLEQMAQFKVLKKENRRL